jgi:hypothetical protein
VQSLGDLQIPPGLTQELIRELAKDAVEDWLLIVSLAISTYAYQVELYVALAFTMKREMKIRRKKKAEKDDGNGEMFYRLVARGLQEAIDDEVEYERLRSDEIA